MKSSVKLQIKEAYVGHMKSLQPSVKVNDNAKVKSKRTQADSGGSPSHSPPEKQRLIRGSTGEVETSPVIAEKEQVRSPVPDTNGVVANAVAPPQEAVLVKQQSSGSIMSNAANTARQISAVSINWLEKLGQLGQFQSAAQSRPGSSSNLLGLAN